MLEELESRIMNKEIRLLAVSKDGSRVINDLNKVNCVLWPNDMRLTLNDVAEQLQEKWGQKVYEDF